MSDCHSFDRGCGSCSGCARELTLTQAELRMLEKLAQIPFLPIARAIDDATPIYLEDSDLSQKDVAIIFR